MAGFSLGCLPWGDLCPPPIWEGQVQGDTALMGGLMRGTQTLWGDLTLIDNIKKLKVLLLLSCNYMIQFIGYDSIKTH